MYYFGTLFLHLLSVGGWDITLWNHVDSVIFYIMWSFTSIVSLLECATVVKESEELKEDKDEKRILHYYST